MSLIEYLERDNWEDVLRRSFSMAIYFLKHDRFAVTSSSIEDLRAWLTRGHISHTRMRLDNQMKERRFPSGKLSTILDTFDQIVEQHRASLLELTSQGILPLEQKDVLSLIGVSPDNLITTLEQINTNKVSLDSMLQSQGLTEKDVQVLNEIINKWIGEQTEKITNQSRLN